MKAAFKTEGKTTTQSALSSKSCGMFSGTSRISFKTVPQFFNLSSSFAWSDALANPLKGGKTTNKMVLKQANSFRIGKSSRGTSCPILLTMQPECHCDNC